MKKVILFLALLLILPTVMAKEGHIKLLAVTDNGNGNMTGSVADLYLEIQPGRGRVFMETFPLTKVDTQMTTRFAKDIACKYTDIDCSRYDFFYTIRAESAIIGGPSAGAATTVLTIAMLKGLHYDNTTAMTGTINSGDVIGFVSGVKQKIEAAAKANLTKVLIPRGEIIDKSDNETLDLGNYGASLGIEIVEVGNIDEALTEFTGTNFKQPPADVMIDEKYNMIMSSIADELCDRKDELEKTAVAFDDSTRDALKAAENLSKQSIESLKNNKPYSGASQCFTAGVKYQQINYLSKNLTRSQVANQTSELLNELQDYENSLAQNPRDTLTDLETFLIVKERLEDAREVLAKLPTEDSRSDSENLAYANERFVSARSWSKFFNQGDGRYILDKNALKTTCIEKISEADERYQYVDSILPILPLTDIRKELESAKLFSASEQYEQCLFSASKAKAQVNSILSSVYIDQSEVDILLNQKLQAAAKVINRQSGKDQFPILGYSYYEYAQTLRQEPFTALLYAEYSLELGNLDMYFRQQKITPSRLDTEAIRAILAYGLALIAGTIFGFVLAIIVLRKPKRGIK